MKDDRTKRKTGRVALRRRDESSRAAHELPPPPPDLVEFVKALARDFARADVIERQISIGGNDGPMEHQASTGHKPHRTRDDDSDGSE